MLYERFAPQPWLEQQFRSALDSEAAQPAAPPTTGRAERFERAELGASSQPGPSSDDLVRAYFRSVGWSEADIRRILSGPSAAEKA